MTEPVTLPPLPGHPEPHTYCWTKLELEEIRAYGHRCFEAGSKQSEVAALPVQSGAWQPISTAQPTLSEQLQTLAELVKDMEDLRAENAQERRRLRQEVSILWEVAYDGIERGDAFYAVVQRRTGQPREQVEHHFLSKEPTK